MKKLLLAVAGLATVSAAMPAVAADFVNVRQANQERRIDAGRRSGKLTVAEAARLHAEQDQIKALAARLKARHGGKLTPADVRMIHVRQDAADRAILHLKDNRARGKNHLKI